MPIGTSSVLLARGRARTPTAIVWLHQPHTRHASHFSQTLVFKEPFQVIFFRYHCEPVDFAGCLWLFAHSAQYFIRGLFRRLVSGVELDDLALAKSLYRIVERHAECLACKVLLDLVMVVSPLLKRLFKLVRGPPQHGTHAYAIRL